MLLRAAVCEYHRRRIDNLKGALGSWTTPRHDLAVAGMLLREMTDELLSGKSLERDLMLRVVRGLQQCGPASSSRFPCFVSVSDKRARDL